MDFLLVSALVVKIVQARRVLIENCSFDGMEILRSPSCSPVLYGKVKEVLNKVPHIPPPYALLDYCGQLQTFLQFNRRNIARLLKAYLLRPWSVSYDRQKISMADGGTIALDWAQYSFSDDTSCLADDAPVVVLLHGLVGDSQSEYIIHFVEALVDAGYRVAVMVKRGCGGLSLTNPQIFSGRRTGDIAAAVTTVKARYPRSKVFWIGYSLGAALTLQYLSDFHDLNSAAEQNECSGNAAGGDSGLQAAMCVSPPWDIESNALRPSLIPQLWTMLLAIPLKLHYLQHFWYLSKENPSHFNWNHLLRVLCGLSMADFDTTLCSSYYNATGQPYANVADYYRDITPKHGSHLITTPTLAVSARDDPLCMHSHCPPAEQLGPGLVVVKTQYGGHLAFPDGLLPLTSAWTDKVAVEWFNSFL